jgi:hypothetical protein
LGKQGSEIIRALLEAQSPHMSNFAERMIGKRAGSYKLLQRFLAKLGLQQVFLQLYQEEAQFVINDPIGMERFRAQKTSYVGTLSDGKTTGYWLLILSTPYRGRSITFSFVVFLPELSENRSLLGNKSITVVLKRSNNCYVIGSWFWIASLVIMTCWKFIPASISIL